MHRADHERPDALGVRLSTGRDELFRGTHVLRETSTWLVRPLWALCARTCVGGCERIACRLRAYAVSSIEAC